MLKTLQSALGALNDMRVHKMLAASYARRRNHAPQKTLKTVALDLVADQDRTQAKALVATAAGAGKRLARIKRFWH